MVYASALFTLASGLYGVQSIVQSNTEYSVDRENMREKRRGTHCRHWRALRQSPRLRRQCWLGAAVRVSWLRLQGDHTVVVVMGIILRTAGAFG